MDTVDKLFIAGLGVLLTAAGMVGYREVFHPCLRYAMQWSDYTYVGQTTNGHAVYGAGYEKVCMERKP